MSRLWRGIERFLGMRNHNTRTTTDRSRQEGVALSSFRPSFILVGEGHQRGFLLHVPCHAPPDFLVRCCFLQFVFRSARPLVFLRKVFMTSCHLYLSLPRGRMPWRCHVITACFRVHRVSTPVVLSHSTFSSPLGLSSIPRCCRPWPSPHWTFRP